MASLKEMRNRIGSVKATQKITKAMQMVAAAKLKRAQDQAESARPYARKMASVIANLAAGVSGDGAPKLLAGTGRDDRHLVVVAAADRGLAGGSADRGRDDLQPCAGAALQGAQSRAGAADREHFWARGMGSAQDAAQARRSGKDRI